jgi:hypothetical protein
MTKTSFLAVLRAGLVCGVAGGFAIVLPIVSPAFVHMLPYSVSLTSELLFGVAAAGAIRWQDTARRVAFRLRSV